MGNNQTSQYKLLNKQIYCPILAFFNTSEKYYNSHFLYITLKVIFLINNFIKWTKLWNPRSCIYIWFQIEDRIQILFSAALFPMCLYSPIQVPPCRQGLALHTGLSHRGPAGQLEKYCNDICNMAHSCILLPVSLAKLLVKSRFKSPLYYNGKQLPTK